MSADSSDAPEQAQRPSTPEWISNAVGSPPEGDPGPPAPRWVGWVFLGLAGLLVPWLLVLWLNLPNRDVVRHYRTAWIGFDILLAFALARTGWLAWRGRDHVELPAVAAATLLVVDAWFDVLTAGRSELTFALLSAVLIEIPLAVLCFAIARNAERVRQQRLHYALRVDPGVLAGRPDPPAKVDP